MEETFTELLTRLQPKPEYLRLFKAVVLDVWKGHQTEASKVTGAVRRRIDSIAQRKNRVIDAYLHEGKIDQVTYQDQLDRLREEHALAEMELNEARIDELDIEAVVICHRRCWRRFPLLGRSNARKNSAFRRYCFQKVLPLTARDLEPPQPV